MKIAFLTRVDAFDKNGGDTYQIQMYKKYLEDDNHFVDIITNLSVPDNYDNYIVVNLDRPLELVIYYAELQRRNLLDKTFVLTIHHDYQCIDFYEKKIRKGVMGIILSALNSHNKREKLKNIARAIKYPALWPFSIKHLWLDYNLLSQKLLNESLGAFLIAEGEKEIICRDFVVSLVNHHLVKNGVDLIGDINSENNTRDIDVLICGRIEPRKNSLAIAEYFKNKPYKVVFAGGMNTNANSYCKQFSDVVADSDNIKYLGRVPPESIPSLYLKSKVNLSASWFEVASLVDLEAYAYGCHVISSQNGHTKDYLGDKAIYIDPVDLSKLDTILTMLIKKESVLNKQHEFIQANYTWEKSTKSLLEGIYKFSGNKIC
ncbi:glycosyltransferase family 4 protein [Edaphovirga cremea]|uniref:glycosyltransferase family 4 protein n=1 Tax=Edaphovirga cremea TaxID=2267246 RepID=UPI000DEF8D29|nr:glycosyltransferase family 4 protein [Edaphovirga cremea]